MFNILYIFRYHACSTNIAHKYNLLGYNVNAFFWQYQNKYINKQIYRLDKLQINRFLQETIAFLYK